MSESHEHDHPRDMDDVVRRLREERPKASALELDEIKRTAIARASRDKGGLGLKRLGTLWRARFTAVALTLALVISGGSAGVIAGGDDNGGNAGNSQYCPPKNGDDDSDSDNGRNGCPDTDTDDNGGGGGGDDSDSDSD